MQLDEVEDHEDDFEVLNVSVRRWTSKRDWVVQVQVENIAVTLKIDTGSQANLLPFGVFSRMHPKPALKPSCAVFRSYGGGVIKHAGLTRIEVTVGEHTTVLDFFVVHKGQVILGK